MLLKKSKSIGIIICVIIVLSFVSLIIPNRASADNQGSADGSQSLTLVCINEDTILSGMEWKIYKVAERVNSNRNFVQVGEFSSFQINFSRLTEERVYEAAQTFQSYAIANQIAPLREGMTDENGEVTFTGLDAGLYLVVGKTLKVDTHYYVPNATLVELKADDGNYKYNIYPKFEYEVANSEIRNYTVEKKWSGDEDNLLERPISITVDLYKDEEYYDTVILSEENNWRYRWNDLGNDSSWIVIEREIPVNYEVEIKFDSTRYSIVNYYSVQQQSSTTTSTSYSTTVTTTTSTVSGAGIIDDNSGTGTITITTMSNDMVTNTGTFTSTVSQEEGSASNTRTTTNKNNNDKVTTAYNQSGGSSSGGSSSKLPQTGQLWWPVVPLSICGIILIAGGLVIRNKKKEE